MPQSLAVVFRVICILGLLFSLTLNGFVINDRSPYGHKQLYSPNKPSYYEYYIDDNNNGEENADFYEYQPWNVKNKRYFGPDELRESVKENLADVISDKYRFKVLEREPVNILDQNDYGEDQIYDENFADDINKNYRNFMDKNKLLNSKNAINGVEQSYEIESKITKDSSGGVKGVARVEGQIMEKTYNGSQPVMKMAKVYASATKDGNEGKSGGWKIQPMKSEFEIMTPKSDKIENNRESEKKKNKNVIKMKNGQDELEQMLIGDDYDMKTINEYIKQQINKNGNKNKDKPRNNKITDTGGNSKIEQKSSPIRKKRTVNENQPHKTQGHNEARSKQKGDDDVNLLKSYIALQDAENHNLMRALDLASEIEFEQQENRFDNKSKQSKLLEEQMRQMRRALSNEKMLGEIKKKIFDENDRIKKLSLKKKFDQSNKKLQNKQQKLNNKIHWNPFEEERDYDYENNISNAFVGGSNYPRRNSYEVMKKSKVGENDEDEISEKLNIKKGDRKMIRNGGDFNEYEVEESNEEEGIPYEDGETYKPYRQADLREMDARKERMVNDYVMKKVSEYVSNHEGRTNGGRRRQPLRLSNLKNDDYFLEANGERKDGVRDGDYDSEATDPTSEYPLSPSYEYVGPVPRYKKNKERWCPEAYKLVDNCRLPREEGLILDADAQSLCNLHQLCFQCGSHYGYSPTECHHKYYKKAERYCQRDKTCLNQAHVLFLNMMQGSSFEFYSPHLCSMACVGDLLA